MLLLLSQGSQFGLRDVEVVTACVDLDEVVSYRCGMAADADDWLDAASADTQSVSLPLLALVRVQRAASMAHAAMAHNSKQWPASARPSGSGRTSHVSCGMAADADGWLDIVGPCEGLKRVACGG